jgi:hypothetical protein
MARRKKPEEETVDETTHRRVREEISNAANRSEKTSWNRKMDNMVKLLAALRPIEDQIIELQAKKIPLFDEIQTLRIQMVKECIHPFEYLIVKDTHVSCKFCEKNLSIPKLGEVTHADA